MSESEATPGVGDSSMDGEKVKAINGMKEVEDVRRMQNGETEKPQINGDVEKSASEGDGETGVGGGGGGSDGGEMEGEAALGERNGSMEEDVEMREEEGGETEMMEDGENVESNEDRGGGGGGDEGGGQAREVEKMEEEEESVSVRKEEEVEKEESGTAEGKTEGQSAEVESTEKEEVEKEEEKMKGEGEEGGDKEKKTEDTSSSTTTTASTTSTSSPSTEVNKEAINGEATPSATTGAGAGASSTTITSSTTTTTTTTTSTPTKKKKHHSSDDVQEVLPTRQLRARRTPKKYTEDDDDVKITNEVIRDDSSDIEMIEESDPLAISDAEVKKIQKEKKEITVSRTKIKTKDPNVIIIDTNTLLKNQGNLAAAVAQSTSSTPVQTLTNRSTSTSTTTTTNLNIQSAIQAITGGAPAQGLQSAYITALQQVLLSQGGQVPMNSQHLAQLQQYYNSLGHLQDDAYVIEAPSFIVPYVMEGKPKEPIKEFLKRINKELEEFERKEKEEEERRAAEEKKRKEEEDKQKRKEEREAEKKRRIEAGESLDDLEKEEEEERAAEAKEKEEKEAEEKKEKEAGEKKKKEEEEEEEEDNKENNKSSTNKEDGKKEEEKDGKVQSKEEKEGERKGKEEKATETVDEDKENKDKSDTESVVDLEKEAKEKEDMSFLGKWEPYYRSALGKFMLELGLNQAQEFLQADLLRMQKRKLEKMKTQPSREGIMAVKLLEKQLEVTRKKNAHLQVPLKICKFCTFKTESEMVMERHLESPHMVNYTYKCNFCDFETRGPQVILFHMEAEHNTRGRLERAPAFFQCSLCPYEDNNKSKMTRHSFSCSKKYKPEKNCELLDWEPPAKIPKVLHIHRGRPNTLGKAFEPVKMPSLLPKNLAGMNISIQSAGGTNLLPSSTVSIAAGRGRGRPVGSYKNPGPLPSQARGINTVSSGSLLYTNRGTTTTTTVQGSGSQQFTLGNQMFQSTARVQRILPSSSSNSPVSLIPGLGASSSITIQSVQSKGGNTKSPQQPSISITPLPRAGQPLSQGSGTKGSSTGRGDSGGNPSFVICEICDGYIKDLEQLRNHMNLIHKVKIHPKMIYNRPPLNCQKCQHRFFTDQGLERHLLGTHGLVTSSMQEAANKGKDAGRCPICGKVFQWKLLNHVSRDHKMTLKPAHLSYKCTVCTATFNMYRLFENHVYSAHSVVNKNKESGKKQSSSGGSSESPLKINDEITIIPQPVVSKSKSSSSSTTSTSTNSSSTSSSNSSSDKLSSKKSDSSTPTMSKEITITKVGSRPTRRSGGGSGGVEVISLDESPKKSENSSSSSKKRAHKDGVGNNTKKARTSS